jgi:hypothetical protein
MRFAYPLLAIAIAACSSHSIVTEPVPTVSSGGPIPPGPPLPSGSGFCLNSLTQFCAAGTSSFSPCIGGWESVGHPPARTCVRLSQFPCTGYDIAQIVQFADSPSFDTSFRYYYDHDTKQLAAVVRDDKCFAGPAAGFGDALVRSCRPPTYDVCGDTDAGASDAAGDAPVNDAANDGP